MPKKTKNEVKETPKIYPSLVLGLDISTACIGVSIVYDDGVNKPQIREIKHIVPKIPSNIDGIEALILRKNVFEENFLNSIKDIGITECVIESPLVYATGNSNAYTVSQLLQFNGILCEAVYRVLGIVPICISSHDAREQSFPELLAIRKFNRKGEIYPMKHIKKALKSEDLVLFGTYPFDCDKKSVMMNMVNEAYPQIEWVRNNKGEIKKENYDACDSLVCALAYINTKRYGNIDAHIKSFSIMEEGKNYNIEYEVSVWDKILTKKIVVPKTEKTKRK